MLMIGIPMYGGQCYGDFMLSIMNLSKALDKKEIHHKLELIQNESLITRGRNGLVAKFMSNPLYTKLLFLDCDLIFKAETIIRMYEQKKPIIGAPYPKKNINWNKVNHFAKKECDVNELQAKVSDMNYNLKYYDKNKVKLSNGFVEAFDVPTGCMLIDKIAMSIIINKNKDFKYVNNCAGYGINNCFYDIFRTGVVNLKGKSTYLSEDYYFCHLARECGIELWLDCESMLGHIGRYTYIGSLGFVLQDPSGEKLDRDNQINICQK